MLEVIAKLFLFVYAINAAAIIKHDDFGNENFLTNSVDKPRVHTGEAEIHTISGTKTQEPNHDAKKLDTLLRQLFDKFVTQDNSNDVVKFGKDGKAYAIKKPIPNQHKRVATTTEQDHEEDMSLKEITNSVERFLDSLNKKEETKTEKKEIKNEYKFESVHGKTSDKSNSDAFARFKDKFSELFLEKRQNLIGTGKDNKDDIHKDHQSLIGTGKDNNNDINKDHQSLIGTGKDHELPPSLIGTGKDNGRKRLNSLYDELRTKTAVHVKEQENQNKRERIELVKEDLVDLMNALQKREKFVYHNGKFSLAAEDAAAEPNLINTGKDHHETPVAGKEDSSSKLETVRLLVKELRDLDAGKKKQEEKESSADSNGNSMKKMEHVFMDAFKKEIEKKKHFNGASKDAGEKIKEKKTSSSVRERLLGLMGKLDQQIKDEENRVIADEKQISQLEKHDVAVKSSTTTNDDDDLKTKSSIKSLENELDEILSEHKRSVRNDDTETVEGLEGFNVYPTRP